MTQTTPTRDEAVLTGWKLVPVEPTEAMMAIGRTCGTNSANTYAAMLASAPAPASGGVDAVIDQASRLMAAGWRGNPNMSGDDRDFMSPSMRRRHDDKVRQVVEFVLASLSPAATPVSEAGGELHHATGERITRKDLNNAYRMGREEGRLAAELLPALAKPASSPAPVRPIGNQGISDYQREIARNMAEGFAAWNAARQEALPSDEPASSPAGGDVREAAKRVWMSRCRHSGTYESTAFDFYPVEQVNELLVRIDEATHDR